MSGALIRYCDKHQREFDQHIAEREERLAKIEIVQIQLPKLPAGWKYSGDYRQPRDGEYIMYQGEVKQARGQKGWYHIVTRAEV